MEFTRYGIRKSIGLPWSEAVARVRELLGEEGFGVLTEIDVRETLKKKIDVDFDRYIILGACNPPLAHRALTAERDIGLLLPCNVIVYEEGDDRSVVAAIDPNTMIELAGGNENLEAVAREVRERLEKVMRRL
jgi:uncharacterized protein (DUF302 family)